MDKPTLSYMVYLNDPITERSYSVPWPNWWRLILYRILFGMKREH